MYLWVKRPIFKGELLGSRSVYVRNFEPLDDVTSAKMFPEIGKVAKIPWSQTFPVVKKVC